MLTGPLFMLQVYDRVLGSRSEETLVALFALVVVLYGLMGVLDYARGRLMARVAARLRVQWDTPLFRASLGRDEPGAPAQRGAALRHMDDVQALLTSPVMLAVFDLPWTPLFLVAIFIFHPMLGWLAVAGGAVLIVLSLLNALTTRRLTQAAQAKTQIAHRPQGQ